MILGDGVRGEIMGPVAFPDARPADAAAADWATTGARDGRTPRLSNSIYLKPDELFRHNLKLQARFEQAKAAEVRYEAVDTDDADIVLDLHCDCEAALHLYTENPCWPQLEPLARLLGAEAVLLAKNSGGLSFDECLSGLWWQLAEKVAELRPERPIPQKPSDLVVGAAGS